MTISVAMSPPMDRYQTTKPRRRLCGVTVTAAVVAARLTIVLDGAPSAGARRAALADVDEQRVRRRRRGGAGSARAGSACRGAAPVCAGRRSSSSRDARCGPRGRGRGRSSLATSPTRSPERNISETIAALRSPMPERRSKVAVRAATSARRGDVGEGERREAWRLDAGHRRGPAVERVGGVDGGGGVEGAQLATSSWRR